MLFLLQKLVHTNCLLHFLYLICYVKVNEKWKASRFYRKRVNQYLIQGFFPRTNNSTFAKTLQNSVTRFDVFDWFWWISDWFWRILMHFLLILQDFDGLLIDFWSTLIIFYGFLVDFARFWWFSCRFLTFLWISCWFWTVLMGFWLILKDFIKFSCWV